MTKKPNKNKEIKDEKFETTVKRMLQTKPKPKKAAPIRKGNNK